MYVTLRFLIFFGFLSVVVHGQGFKSYNKKANDLFLIQDYKNALHFFLVLDSLSPGNPEINYRIGYCYLQSSQRLKSLSYFQTANNLGYKASGMNFNLGLALHANHQMEDAANQFQQAIVNLKNENADSKKLNEAQRYLKIAQTGMALMSKPLDVKITNAGAKINTACPEYAPVISADEGIIIFTSQRPCLPSPAKSHATNEDIYIAHQDTNRAWGQAELIGREINSAGNDASIGLSADGQKLFIYKDVGKGDIYESEFRGAKWSYPQRLPPPVNSPFWEPSISISPDRSTIYFVSSRPGGKGGRDLYTSTFNNHEGIWSEPKNLHSLNTTYNEDAPFIHSDGKTLYFSSEGHNTMGGFDIFESHYLPDSMSWSVPENVGYPINTANDDIFFVWNANGERGYFSSDREGGYGLDDIYIVSRKSKQLSLIMLKGTVVADSTQQPLEAEITVINNITGTTEGTFVSNSVNGKFLLMLATGNNYGISITRKGYLPYSENINVRDSGFSEINKRIILSPVKSGKATVLKNVFFDSGKWELKEESFATLNQIASFLKGNKGLHIEIAGFTDNVGDDRQNQTLSQHRAEAVRSYLVNRGLPPTIIKAVGYGEGRTVGNNDSEEGRSLNRRTELIIR